mmetsp:Transcript_52282/g.59328  ORF Transcript_52282/g.59328 Transcript_52282/m.59328 type:complete len:241 (+) Transcript_52282:538-1260(+)
MSLVVSIIDVSVLAESSSSSLSSLSPPAATNSSYSTAISIADKVSSTHPSRAVPSANAVRLASNCIVDGGSAVGSRMLLPESIDAISKETLACLHSSWAAVNESRINSGGAWLDISARVNAANEATEACSPSARSVHSCPSRSCSFRWGVSLWPPPSRRGVPGASLTPPGLFTATSDKKDNDGSDQGCSVWRPLVSWSSFSLVSSLVTSQIPAVTMVPVLSRYGLPTARKQDRPKPTPDS